MSWNNLTEDTQQIILNHDCRAIVAAKVCLCDDECYNTQKCCVSFLQVEGTWLSGNFACNVDEDLIPEWEDDDPIIECWMDFSLRKKDSGVLVLPCGDGWIEVGMLKNVYIPMYTTWHGVMTQTSTTKIRYNCVWFHDVSVYEKCDKTGWPGYSLHVIQDNKYVTHDECGSKDPFNVYFHLDP